MMGFIWAGLLLIALQHCNIVLAQNFCRKGYFCESNNGTMTLCPKGHYCPLNTRVPIPCPDDGVSFCPLGSASILTIETPGRYVDKEAQQERMCEQGYFCDDLGVKTACPAGRFGSEVGESDPNCAGPCETGFYCPAASTRATEKRCSSPLYYCPEGSPFPTLVDLGFYSPENRTMQIVCPVGFYCQNGIKYPCPPGTYNPSTEGLTARSQCLTCPAGHICYESSIQTCGNASKFCLQGDGNNPYYVELGEYTVGLAGVMNTTATVCEYGNRNGLCEVHNYNALHFPGRTNIDDPATRTEARMCEKGFYCIDGNRYQCRPGTFGGATGLHTDECSGVCEAGFYCPSGSISGKQFECPEKHFCPTGSGSPHPVQLGYYISTNKDAEIICPLGHWCDAFGVKHLCDAGKYGNVLGLSDPKCSGLCPPGYFCETGTKDPFGTPCLDANTYCPIGSKKPRQVLPGYYSNDDHSWQHSCEEGYFCVQGNRKPCPSGTFGNQPLLGSDECSGLCPSGYFCFEGQVDPHKYPCEAALGLSADDQTFRGNNVADKSCLVHLLSIYPEQWFEFSILNKNQERDPSLWNLAYNRRGRYDVYNTMEWDSTNKGFRARGEFDDEYMETGWRPGSGPKTACFWKKFLTDDIFGLDGLQKSEADNDYFMIGTYYSYKNRIFASSGVNRGDYGFVEVDIKKEEWIFYCLASGGAGSSSEAYVATPDQSLVKVWAQEDNGLDRGILPSKTHISMVYGKTSTGETDRPTFYLTPSHAYSDAVYGGILHWDAHLSEEEIWNAFNVTSHFYQGKTRGGEATKLQCGAIPSLEWKHGFNGRHAGPVPNIYFEKDKNGFYQPVQQRTRQFQTPDFLVPFLPRVVGNGPEMLICPRGSGVPKVVSSGFYKDGHGEKECEPGFYCQVGKRFPCPGGYFGNQAGLISSTCSGICPAGFRCPIGTVEPIPCFDNYYAPKQSQECISCGPGVMAICKTARTCCQPKH